MKLLIKHKIFLLVFFSIISTFVISSYIYYINLKNFATQNAYKESLHDIKMINVKIKDIKIKSDNFINRLTLDEDIISSLHLISNYQDKNSYDKSVFKSDKKRIMTKISNILGPNSFWSAKIFDSKKDIVAFKRKKIIKLSWDIVILTKENYNY